MSSINGQSLLKQATRRTRYDPNPRREQGGHSERELDEAIEVARVASGKLAVSIGFVPSSGCEVSPHITAEGHQHFEILEALRGRMVDDERIEDQLERIRQHLTRIEGQTYQHENPDQVVVKYSTGLLEMRSRFREYMGRIDALLALGESSLSDPTAEIPRANLAPAFSGLLSVMIPEPHKKRIQFPDRDTRLRALPILWKQGGYSRYKNSVLGVSARQIDLLRRLKIPFTSVD